MAGEQGNNVLFEPIPAMDLDVVANILSSLELGKDDIDEAGIRSQVSGILNTDNIIVQTYKHCMKSFPQLPYSGVTHVEALSLQIHTGNAGVGPESYAVL